MTQTKYAYLGEVTPTQLIEWMFSDQSLNQLLEDRSRESQFPEYHARVERRERRMRSFKRRRAILRRVKPV